MIRACSCPRDLTQLSFADKDTLFFTLLWILDNLHNFGRGKSSHVLLWEFENVRKVRRAVTASIVNIPCSLKETVRFFTHDLCKRKENEVNQKVITVLFRSSVKENFSIFLTIFCSNIPWTWMSQLLGFGKMVRKICFSTANFVLKPVSIWCWTIVYRASTEYSLPLFNHESPPPPICNWKSPPTFHCWTLYIYAMEYPRVEGLLGYIDRNWTVE